MRVTSLRWLAVIATTPLALLGVGPSQADIIHESATLGRTGQQGGTTLGEQFLGSRFTITQTVNVTLIGGHMEATGTLFGAIVALSGPSALPSGSPVDKNWLASTVFSPGTPSTDARTPLAVTLPPGDYALIFGSQQFGATGSGTMPSNDILSTGT